MTNPALQNDMAPAVVSVTRSASALRVRMLTFSQLNVSARRLHEAMESVDFAALCQAQTASLNNCPVSPDAVRGRLADAWQALASAQTPDADALFHVLVVLLETVLEPSVLPALPPLAFAAPDTLPARRPTAAHPRAYRGTTFQPPKLKAPASVDLRPYLCGASNIALILARLRPFLPDALTRLAGAGYDTPRLALLPSDVHGPDDIYIAYHHAATQHEQAIQGGAARLPALFRTHLLPLLRGAAWPDVRRYAALYGRLGLDTDADLRNAFARLLRLQNDIRTLHWGEVIARQSGAWRVPMCCLLAQTGAYRCDPDLLSPNAAQWLTDPAAHSCPVYSLYCLLRACALGIDADYMLKGFAIADKYIPPNRHIHIITHSGPCPLPVVERIAARIDSVPEWERHHVLRVWEACGKMAGFGQAMDSIAWEQYAPAVANSYMCLFISLLWQDWTDAQKARCWRFVRQHVGAMESLLHDIHPAYQAKCVALLRECVWEWGAQADANALFARICPLIRRLCAAPFRASLPDVYIFAQLVSYLDAAQWAVWVSAPDSAFVRLEAACARRNNATLVRAGVWSLARSVPDWLCRCFARYPAKLCRVARLLGCFSDGLRDQVVRAFGAAIGDGLDAPDVLLPNLTGEDACAWVMTHCAPGCTDPIPRALREHVAGRKILDAPRLTHYRAELQKGVYLAQLEMLENAALDVLCRGYQNDPDDAGDIDKSGVLHALQMRCHSAHNRRAWGKFLRAYLGGDTDYIRAHPRSQAWLARHPGLSLDTWLRGVQVEPITLDGIGSVQLSVEQNPLEALKMGTSVGSCLGLGGDYAHSAIANVLDINKQVVYARDASGTILARQLAAISEEGHLVCFEVYPVQADAAVQRLFRQYDHLWADALGLPLYRYEPDSDYTIANVLSTRWWDDCSWNFIIHETESTAATGAATPGASGK